MPEPRRARLPLALAILAMVAGCAIQAPDPTEPRETTPRPTPSPTPGATLQPGQTAAPSTVPTPAPTPDVTLLDLSALSCPGGVVLDWSPSSHPDFHHYTALRSPERQIARNWPPVAPAVDWGRTYATDRFVTDAVDASIIPTDRLWHYRVMAYNASGRAIAASPVRTAQLRDEVDLGSLQAEPGDDDVVMLTWRPYRGVDHCFSAYRVLAGHPNGQMETLIVVSDQEAGSIETRALDPGVSYELRVEAIRTTTLGSFVLGRTTTPTFTPP